LEPDYIAVLDKGQRSVKGLSSGYENVVTVDLIISMRKTDAASTRPLPSHAPPEYLQACIDAVLNGEEGDTPSHVYVGVVREFLRHGYDPSDVSIAEIAGTLVAEGYEVDQATG